MRQKKIKRFCEIIRNVLCILVILTIMLAYKVKRMRQIEVSAQFSADSLKYMISDIDNKIEEIHLPNLRAIISNFTSIERILNRDVYGEIKPDTVILVINLYKPSTYFKYFLMSLSQVRGIEQALIVFSHSYYDVNINRLIESIDFCRVLQIFYPYSIQLYPNKYPGNDPLDCPHGMDIKTAEELNCTGALFPDIHGYYREPAYSERKLHWWWTANKVFDNLTWTEEHTGMVVFLEDDLYLMPDFMYMILYMKSIAETLPQCELISLGSPTTDIVSDFYESTNRVEVSTWDPKTHSILAFGLSVWNIIASHYDLFCDIDDYTWARSIFYLSSNRRDGKRFQVMTTSLPRAYKISSCENIWNYNIVDFLYDLLNLQKSKVDEWFPPYIEVYTQIEIVDDEYFIFEYVENNGGWNDPRDKDLCNNITVKKIKKILLDMEKQFIAYEN